jgi:hypothetical protein
MGWWRSRRRFAAGLGVFAIVVQIVLSLGHLHFDHSGRDAVGVVAAGQYVAPSGPRHDQAPAGLPDDDCPICITLHMVAVGVLPPPPATVPPTLFSRDALPVVLEAQRIGWFRHLLFQTRAPPIA